MNFVTQACRCNLGFSMKMMCGGVFADGMVRCFFFFMFFYGGAGMVGDGLNLLWIGFEDVFL